ncbi:hypothetical protein FB45DRAFT_786791 [Roridomyces roridus]|uniref:DUF6741 domain-containing protein n=1 Tax=Roridomyces roridus TaxID=1738132 RepID=A0AAD7C3W2_9AGAR|nr:hypothetical protein FB45DRAFT_786791 [Roridomyces roridus]
MAMARTMSRRQSLPYAPPMGGGYSYGTPGYSQGYSQQGYSSYGDPGYSYGSGDQYGGGMYNDPQYGEYGQASYPGYGAQPGIIPPSHRLTGPSYEDDPYYGDEMQIARPHTPMSYGTTGRRHRRHSVSYSALPPVVDGGRYRSSSMHIKFKRKGSLLAGIPLGDAQSTRTRLSGNDDYTLHDLHTDQYSRRIHLRVRWNGYAPLTYEVPLDVYDGRVSMDALSRRVARACVHYLQFNMVPVMYSRVELHHLEEVSYGVWQPMLSTR